MTEESQRVGSGSELRALVAYACLAGFIRTAADADSAPDVAVKAAMASVAITHHERYRLLAETLRADGLDPQSTMTAFVPAVDAFHARTVPGDWLEGVVKAYIGAGSALDLLAEAPTLGHSRAVGADESPADVLGRVIRESIAADHRIAGRLALWGRRLAGEALSQAQRVAADRPGLIDQIVEARTDVGSDDLTRVGELFVRLTGRHAGRMRALGLTA